MLQLSIFAFALGGAALSFAYFDLIFALFALVAVFDLRILPAALPTSHERAAKRAVAGPAAARPQALAS